MRKTDQQKWSRAGKCHVETGPAMALFGGILLGKNKTTGKRGAKLRSMVVFCVQAPTGNPGRWVDGGFHHSGSDGP